MPSITLKSVPEALMERLRARAKAERRSMTQQALVLLEQSLSAEYVDLDRSPAAQVATWSELAGRWAQPEELHNLGHDLRAARTGGRQVDL